MLHVRLCHRSRQSRRRLVRGATEPLREAVSDRCCPVVRGQWSFLREVLAVGDPVWSSGPRFGYGTLTRSTTLSASSASGRRSSRGQRGPGRAGIPVPERGLWKGSCSRSRSGRLCECPWPGGGRGQAPRHLQVQPGDYPGVGGSDPPEGQAAGGWRTRVE